MRSSRSLDPNDIVRSLIEALQEPLTESFDEGRWAD